MDYFHCVYLVVILLSVKVEFLSGADGLARALDLSWRPLSHSPYQQQQFFQNNAPAALITYSHFDAANKDEIVEAAKHNAQLLKKYKEIANHPITSYSDPYQMHSQTPAPQSKLTTAYHSINTNRPQQQHLVSAASNHVISRVAFPVKSVGPLYQTKLTFLGKPEGNAIYHQNAIHQAAASSSPKVAGYTKEFGRVNFHYHHPSITSSLSTSTKRVPVFSSSVTPQTGFLAGSKHHPVMTKFQAHMALASQGMPQGHHHKLKQNYGFSPPSHLMSNYANFGPATSNPFWHTGFAKQNGMHHHLHDFHPSYHLSSGPEASQHQQHYQNVQQTLHDQKQQHHQNQQQHHQSQGQNNQKPQIQQQPSEQSLPSVHPSVLTPFLEQVHLKQKEAAAEQKNAQKQSQEPNSNENNGSYEVINDVWADKNLVPPPPNAPQNFNTKKPTKEEKPNKYNLSMKSPLQDASRFNYENVISTAVTPTPYDPQRFKPSASDNTYLTTDKPPKVFGNLNRPRDNVYKQHKLLHPSYTGSAKRKPEATAEKHFLPTPYKPEKEVEEIKIENFEPQHSFFTIEDAVTPKLISYHVVKSHIPVDEKPETYTFKYSENIEDESTKLTLTTPAVTPAVEQQSPKPRQKLRRRKPKPKQPIVVLDEQKKEEVREKPTVKPPNQLRGSIRNVDTQPQQNDFRSKKRVNSVRNKINFSSPAATSTTFDYDATLKPSTEEAKREELTTVHLFTSEAPTSAKEDESSERPENVKRRVRLRYKNKLRQDFNSVEPNDFKLKTQHQISEAESENVPVKQSTDSYEPSIATESVFNETRSTLKLPNLKLRNEVLTTFSPSPNVESLSSVSPSETTASAQENNIHNKIANRPRFSIKEIKRKQLSSPSTTSAATTTTTSKPDGQRFNRLRVSLNRKRNETIESTEESEVPKRKYSSSRPSTAATTESTIQTSLKRGTLPKRTFPPRNFTKPAAATESETTTSLKPSTKSSTNFNTNRTIGSLRSRIQNFKKKETLADIEETTVIPTRKFEPSSEAATVEELPASTTSTELPPVKHETSIMKIAKTPSTVNVVKSTTSNSIDEANETSRSDFDLTGSPSEHSQRVAELTISGNDNYSNFKSANIGPLSRRIPNYFTISTDDPILPIQAFFPQIKANEEANFTK